MRINERLDAEAAANGWWPRRNEPEIREQLVRHYQQFAEKIAVGVWKKIDHGSLELDEMYCAAHLGLMQAIDRYDPESATAFTSFATWRVRGECIELARSHDWVPHGARTAANAGKAAIPLMLSMQSDSSSDVTAPPDYIVTRDPGWLSEHAPEPYRPLLRGLFDDPDEEQLSFKATAKRHYVTEGQLRLVARHAIARAVNG